MAFVHRAERTTGGVESRTGPGLGPGSYELGAQPTEQLRGRAPFGSTAERLGSGSQFVTPGPGTYIYDQPLVTDGNETGAFASKTRRFAARDDDEMPGPGEYTQPDRWGTGKKGARFAPVPADQYGAREGANVVWFRNPSAPSIPAHDQSYGYETGANGKLVRQPPPPGGFSGKADDAPGPGDYHQETGDFGAGNMHSSAKPGAGWSRSKAKRDFRTPGAGGDKDVPGPGTYNLVPSTAPAASSSGRPLTGYSTSSTAFEGVELGGTAPFKSGTGRFGKAKGSRLKKQEKSPGPGAYTLPSSLKVHSRPEHLQFFGSTSRRSTDVDPTSYAAPFTMKTPGPGSYEATSLFKKPAAARLGGRAAQAAPFNNKAIRFTGLKKTDAPGPGSYAPEKAGSMVRQLERKTQARNGVFGTSAERWSQPTESELGGPGPGTYELEMQLGEGGSRGGRRRRPQRSSTFASQTTRFPAKDSQQDGPAPGDYDIAASFGARNKRLTLLDREVFISGGPRFNPREVAPGKFDNGVPGPGQYKMAGSLAATLDPRQLGSSALQGRASIGTEARFSDSGARAKGQVPGPGHYNQHDPRTALLKRSYNITVDV